MSKISLDFNDLNTTVQVVHRPGGQMISIKNGKDHVVLVGLPKLAMEKIVKSLKQEK
jgi:hypothetical protein